MGLSRRCLRAKGGKPPRLLSASRLRSYYDRQGGHPALLNCSSGRVGLMLILKQARKKLGGVPKMNSLLLLSAALALSVPFGFFGAQTLNSYPAGLVLSVSLFAYTILLTRMLKRRPPLFLKRLFPRRDLSALRDARAISGLRLDYIGARDAEDGEDGVVHNAGGELHRILRCSLGQESSLAGQAELFETLFADLSQLENSRFQVIFPQADYGRRKEMFVVVTLLSQSRRPAWKSSASVAQMQSLSERVLERLITLGIAPRIMNALEVRQLISSELGACSNKHQQGRDWLNAGNLRWEPGFRDTVVRPAERFMQVADRRSFTIALDELPASSSFEWLPALLSDMPGAHLSLFITPSTLNPLNRLTAQRKLQKQSAGAGPAAHAAARMSFFVRFDNRNLQKLESAVAIARRYLSSLGINTSASPQSAREQQLLNWRATLPCASEQSSNRHLLAFASGRPASRKHA
jgi:hypothetical protein